MLLIKYIPNIINKQTPDNLTFNILPIYLFYLSCSMATLELALQIAAKAHAGQKQRNGEPYILHPLRVMTRVPSLTEKMAAVLHDVVEDSPWTIQMLRMEGFSEEVLELVDLLTHYEKDSYDDYVEKLKNNPRARRIKIADLEDNMNIRRLERQLTEKDLNRLNKYHTYWRLLTEVEENS